MANKNDQATRHPLDLRPDDWIRHSVTYQMILEEGMERGMAIAKLEGLVEGRRESLLLVGGERLGQPAPAVVSALDQIADADRLRQLLARVGKVASWEELLGLPTV